MLRRILQAALVAGALAVLGCPKSPPDIDDERPKALRISPGVLVKDGLEGKDRIDWKDFSYYQDAKVTVVFSVGDRFKSHRMEGEITLFDFQGNILQKRTILPETVDYPFQFNAVKEKPYFFKIESLRGSAAYLVETRVEPLDPCAACAEGTTCCKPTNLCCAAGTVCRNGACVAGCDCADDEVCVDGGRCEPACASPCRRGTRCDVSRRKCVPVSPGTPAPPGPAPVRKPTCTAGEVYNADTNECDPLSAIIGSVLSVSDDGGAALVLINKGTQDGVRRGASGTVGGAFAMTIREATATRSKGKVQASPQKIKNGMKVRINK